MMKRRREEEVISICRVWVCSISLSLFSVAFILLYLWTCLLMLMHFGGDVGGIDGCFSEFYQMLLSFFLCQTQHPTTSLTVQVERGGASCAVHDKWAWREMFSIRRAFKCSTTCWELIFWQTGINREREI